MKGAVSVGLVTVALMLGSADACAAAQMYKCIVGGRTVYQQLGCPVEAEPASAPARAASAGASARPQGSAERAASSAARRVRPASAKASSVPATPR